MKFFREDIAVELVKAMITSDQRELVQTAEKLKIKTVDAVADVAFKYADALIKRAKK